MLQVFKNMLTYKNGALDRVFGMLYLYLQNQNWHPHHSSVELRFHLRNEFVQARQRYMEPWIRNILTKITALWLWHDSATTVVPSSSSNSVASYSTSAAVAVAAHMLPPEIWCHILDYALYGHSNSKNVMLTCKFFFVHAHRAWLNDTTIHDGSFTHWIPQESYYSYGFCVRNWTRMIQHAMFCHIRAWMQTNNQTELSFPAKNNHSLGTVVAATSLANTSLIPCTDHRDNSSSSSTSIWKRTYQMIAAELQPYLDQYQCLYFRYLCARDFSKYKTHTTNVLDLMENQFMTLTVLPSNQIRTGLFIEGDSYFKLEQKQILIKSLDLMAQNEKARRDDESHQDVQHVIPMLPHRNGCAIVRSQSIDDDMLEWASPRPIHSIATSIRALAIIGNSMRDLPIEMPTLKHQIDTMVLHGSFSLFRCLVHDWPKVHTLHLCAHDPSDLYMVFYDCRPDQLSQHVSTLSVGEHVAKLMHLFPALRRITIAPDRHFVWDLAVNKSLLDALLNAWQSKAHFKLVVQYPK